MHISLTPSPTDLTSPALPFARRSMRTCTLDFASRSFRLSSQLSNSAVRSIFTIRELYPMVYVQSSAFIHNVESSTDSQLFNWSRSSVPRKKKRSTIGFVFSFARWPIIERERYLFSGESQEINDLLYVASQAAAK